ncbi:MAG TPA: hypothetical protein PKG85_04205 [Mesotoga infera]|nr:hypothetical protein [Mesotoga infera]
MWMLSKEVQITEVEGPTAAGTDAIESTAIDISNYDGCAIMTTVAKKTATTNYNKVAVYQSSATALDDSTETLLKEYTVTKDNLTVLLDVFRPREEYGKYIIVKVTRGTSTAVGPIYAMRYAGRVKPVDNTDVADNGIYSAALINQEDAS